MKSSIIGHEITIDFPIYENSHRSIKKALIAATTGGVIGKDTQNHVVVRAIDGLSFEFHEGDRIGLLGHNGSGKTTLLRVLSGVYDPVGGWIEVRGRIASLLELSVGLDQDATGYENIFLRGVLMGLTPKEIEAKTEQISQFSELGNYLNLPVRTYSSGMMLRLAFSIATSVEADIILMDEWLSVGDADFSLKASAKLKELVDNAHILVIASHSPELINSLCNRIIRLEHGKVIEDYRPDPISDNKKSIL